MKESSSLGDAALVELFEHTLDRRQIRSVFQPIVRLDDRGVIGHEALSRGPLGSRLELPGPLFELASRVGRTAALDRLCRETAITSAIRAGGDRVGTLFINTEPGEVASLSEHELDDLADHRLDVVLELAERKLFAAPAELLGVIDRARTAGWRIALDDVGSTPESVALLPLAQPDIVKLDGPLLRRRPNEHDAAVVRAAQIHQERTGCHILAEWIETEEDLEVALGYGATLGQGFLFGRPNPMDDVSAPARHQLDDAPQHAAIRSAATPFDVVAPHARTMVTRKPHLVAVSKQMEQVAAGLVDRPIVMGAFQTQHHFTDQTARRFEALADHAVFVGALGIGMGPEPASGVRGGQLPPDHPLCDEWSVTVLSPSTAMALVARELHDDGPESSHRFRYAVTQDRDLVVAATASLLRMIKPH